MPRLSFTEKVRRAAKVAEAVGGEVNIYNVSDEHATMLWLAGFRPWKFVRQEDAAWVVWFSLHGSWAGIRATVFTANRPALQWEIDGERPASVVAPAPAAPAPIINTPSPAAEPAPPLSRMQLLEVD